MLAGLAPPWPLSGGGCSSASTLLERSEIRDLADVKALLDAGGDLDAALRDAPTKDAGFSPVVEVEGNQRRTLGHRRDSSSALNWLQ